MSSKMARREARRHSCSMPNCNERIDCSYPGKCETCHGIYCDDHLTECDGDDHEDLYFCPDHITACPSCGGNWCDDCWIENSGMMFCPYCWELKPTKS